MSEEEDESSIKSRLNKRQALEATKKSLILAFLINQAFVQVPSTTLLLHPIF